MWVLHNRPNGCKMEENESQEHISSNNLADFSAKEGYVDFILQPKEELVFLYHLVIEIDRCCSSLCNYKIDNACILTSNVNGQCSKITPVCVSLSISIHQSLFSGPDFQTLLHPTLNKMSLCHKLHIYVPSMGFLGRRPNKVVLAWFKFVLRGWY